MAQPQRHRDEQIRDDFRHKGSADGSRDDSAPVPEAEKPRDIPAEGWKEIGKRVVQEIKKDRLPVVSAGLAFYALLAIFPGLIALVSIYGLVADPSDIERQISEVADVLPDGAATLIEGQLQNIVETSPGALGWTAAIAILGALWTASSGTQQLVKAVNEAYDEDEKRGFVKVRGLAIALTLAFMVLAVISLGLIVVIPPLLSALEVATGLEWLIAVGRFALLAAVMVVALSVVYRYAPNRDEPRWQWASWGAVIAVIIWIAASILFSVYVSNFGSYGQTYGSLAGVIILMFWFYISAFIILLGAEINAEMEHQTSADTTEGEARPMGERDAVKADTLPEHDRR